MLRIIITAPYFRRSHAFHGVAGHGQEAVATGSIIPHCSYNREQQWSVTEQMAAVIASDSEAISARHREIASACKLPAPMDARSRPFNDMVKTTVTRH